MRKVAVVILGLICFHTVTIAQDQKDTSIRKAAVSICNCLEKMHLEKAETEAEMQEVFLQCILDSASGIMGEALLAEGGDMEENGEAFGEKIALELMNMGCAPFIQMSLKLAKDNLGEEGEKPELKSAEGVVVKTEERDFLYITVKTTAGRELTFVYMDFVDGSDGWLKEADAKLKNKNVKVQYLEMEVYQPRLKDFANIRSLKTLEFVK